ncbi:uncharacterized protein LOC135953840 [Calliphora vicina]|uniref:uncharacterized protein LOC135953840 n=1 Tax=Calliphora vicina TaxID=7373 RepID=UPI00325C04CA
MEIKPSQVAAIAFMLGYTIFGLICIKLVYTRMHCKSPFYFTEYHSTLPVIRTHTNVTLVEPPQALFDDRYCAGSLHGFFSSLSTFILGYAVVIYRLLNGTRTRFVKLVHAGLHGIALVLFVVGYLFLFFAEYMILHDLNRFHAITSMFASYMFLLQLAVGLSVFLFQRNVQLRLMFAPFHDVFGIWLLIILVACCLSGKRNTQIDYELNNQYAYYSLTFVSYSFVLIVVLNPYFEWDLV